MSDVEIEDGFGESNEEIYSNEDQESEENKEEKDNECDHNKQIPVGKKLTHFLPFRMPYTGQCNVNAYFDSLIEPMYKNNANSADYIASFRGKTFNGKKIYVTEENFVFGKINYTNIKGSLQVNKVEEINEYYNWKFDEEIEPDNNLCNMSNLIRSLDILK